MRSGSVLLVSLLCSACAGGLVTAPHRARESELGPAAVDARYDAVVEKAAAFERQNGKSRDVYWYRVWRASGMISLGQVAEGEQLVDQVLTELTSLDVNVAEAPRLRMFAYDAKAKGALLRQQPIEAIGFLDRALSLAIEIKPDTGGRCDRDLMIASRIRQIMEIAANAGDADRPARSRPELEKRLADWASCLARSDYPTMHALGELRGNLGLEVGPQTAAVVTPVTPVAPTPVTPPPAKPAAPAPAPAPKAAPAPAPLPAPAPAGAVTGLKVASVRYGPIDSSPYKEQMDALVRLLEKTHKGVVADALIRVDGQKRALRLRLPGKKFEGVGSLVPLFKNTVVFFERTREIEPKLDEVVVVVEAAEGAVTIMAAKGDVFDLFVDKIDAGAFQSRLTELR